MTTPPPDQPVEPRQSEPPERPRRKWPSRLIWGAGCSAAVVALGLVVYFALTFTPLGWILLPFQQNPGTFHRHRYEAVVEKVRTMNLSPGQVTALRLDDISSPQSLRLLKPEESFERGQGAGCVWAEVSADGKLKVVIETNDMGHAGEYGFAYSDVPLVPRSSPPDWFELDVPSHLTYVQPDMKIDDHWWKVLYNMD
jgi:hypothetical protein